MAGVIIAIARSLTVACLHAQKIPLYVRRFGTVAEELCILKSATLCKMGILRTMIHVDILTATAAS